MYKRQEQYRMCRACLDVLENSTDALGRKIDVVKLAMPKPIYMTEEEVAGLDLFDGEPTRDTVSPLSASYVNLYIGNKVVVMPCLLYTSLLSVRSTRQYVWAQA